MPCDFLQHSLGVIQNLFVCESSYPQTMSNHVCISILIVIPLLILIVHRAITLNHKLGLSTVEVRNVVTKLMLSSEFESEQLAVAEELP